MPRSSTSGPTSADGSSSTFDASGRRGAASPAVHSSRTVRPPLPGRPERGPRGEALAGCVFRLCPPRCTFLDPIAQARQIRTGRDQQRRGAEPGHVILRRSPRRTWPRARRADARLPAPVRRTIFLAQRRPTVANGQCAGQQASRCQIRRSARRLRRSASTCESPETDPLRRRGRGAAQQRADGHTHEDVAGVVHAGIDPGEGDHRRRDA